MSKCNSCKADIDWVTTVSGKKMPVNKDYITIVPLKDGNTIVITSSGSVVKGDIVGDAYEGRNAVSGSTSHFATCPAAQEHRRG